MKQHIFSVSPGPWGFFKTLLFTVPVAAGFFILLLAAMPTKLKNQIFKVSKLEMVTHWTRPMKQGDAKAW